MALHKEPLIVNDPEHDARHDLFIAEKIGVPARSILAVPLLAPRATPSDEPQTLGAIELVNKRTSTGDAGFDDGDLRLLTLIAGQVSRAITHRAQPRGAAALGAAGVDRADDVGRAARPEDADDHRVRLRAAHGVSPTTPRSATTTPS